MSELPDIILLAVLVIALFACLWPRKPESAREKPSAGEILMKVNVAGGGHAAAVREIEAYALMITDDGKDKIVRAIGRCYYPTKTHWPEEFDGDSSKNIAHTTGDVMA